MHNPSHTVEEAWKTKLNKNMLTINEAALLHGHKGPWLVLGYKIGLKAVEILKPENEHQLQCTAILPMKTPYTCSLDGIQASTKCTLGKLNIKVIESNNSNNITYIFINKNTEESLEIKLKPQVEEKISQIYNDRGLEAAAKWVEEEELCNLIIMKQST